MRDVSCRVVIDHLQFMRRRGTPVEPFFAGLKAELGDVEEASPGFVEDPDHWISWHAFVVMGRLWSRVMSEADEAAFIEYTVTHPVKYLGAVAPMLRVVTGPAQIYWLAHAYGGKVNFPTINSTYEDLPGGRIRLVLSVRDGDEPAPHFFRLTLKSLTQLPRLIGYPPAVVDGVLDGRDMIFTIVPPTSRSFLARLRRYVQVLTAARSLMAEVATRDTMLREYNGRLERARLELEAKVQERTQELAAANRELAAARDAADAASRAKSAFLANMSHEIRTPMSSILGFAELLAGPHTPESLREPHLEKILRNGRHLLALIDDSLDLASIEAGRLRVAVAPCSPATELRQATDALRSQAEAKGLALALELVAPFPATMRTDATRLRQILWNLVGNALKFTAHGRVEVVAQADGASLRLTVRDTGAGISAEARPLLFEPFTQVPGAPKHPGSGLGLALARRLAQALGGDVVLAESTPGKGSVFVATVLLELPDAHPAEHDRAPQAASAALPANARVLVVEDTADLRELLTATLEGAGARVTCLPNGESCVATVAAHKFDVVLLDMHMPVVDGYETAMRLRNAGFRRPIIALTAFAMPTERAKCFAAGCDDFLAKPVETSQLVRTVARWLRA